MKDTTVTKKEVRKSLDAKKIRLNLIIYAALWLIPTGISVALFLNQQETTGLILFTIFTIIHAYLVGYQLYRYIRLMVKFKNMPCHIVKLDRVNTYMNGKIPVFAVAIPTNMGTRVVETNAIYKQKNVDTYRNHKVKALYDAEKNRIYVITLVD